MKEVQKMLKAKKVLRQLRSADRQQNKYLDIRMRELIEALAPYEVDSRKLTGKDFDDTVWNNADTEADIEWNEQECGNSYNWSSDLVFNWEGLRINGRELIAFKAHISGDVRCNYTDIMLLDMSMSDFWETVADTTSVCFCTNVRGRYDVSLSTDATLEGNVFTVSVEHVAEGEVYNNQLYISDIDTSERNKRKLTKQVRALFKKGGELGHVLY